MNTIDVYSALASLAKGWISSQVIHDGDYYDQNGLLVCGACGEPRQQIEMIPHPFGNDPGRADPIKVTRQCKCEREAEEAEKQREQIRNDSERLLRLRKASYMDQKYYSATFDAFEVNKANEKNFAVCKRYAEDFDIMAENNQGLLLWGDVGTGKTFAAACIANALLQKKVPVIMTSFVKLLSLIHDGEESEREILDRMERAKLVVFDDLGAERGTEYALEKVYGIVNARDGQNLPSIYTTNLTLAQMKSETNVRFSRIYDRIFASCSPLQFTGTSWRRREAGRRYEEFKKLLDG